MKLALAATLSFALLYCTVKVETGDPQITIRCVEVMLPGGAVTTECPDAGDAGE